MPFEQGFMGETNERRALEEGKRAFLSHDYMEAAKYFRAATLAEPTDADAWRFLGFSLNAGGSAGEAVAAFEKSLGLEPGCMETVFGLGLAFLASGDDQGAIREFEKVFSVDPGHRALKETLVATLVRHGRDLMGVGNVEWAGRHLSRAYEINDECPEVILALRDYYCLLDDHDRAVKMVMRLEEVKPDYPNLMQMKEDFGLLKERERGWLY